jgi:hypothetical protein
MYNHNLEIIQTFGQENSTAPFFFPPEIGHFLVRNEYFIFSEIQTDEDRQKLASSVFDMLNPNSTNPQIVIRTIQMFEYMISTISKTFEISLDSINVSNPISTVSSNTARSFKISKLFEGFSDTSITKSFGIDYLSNTTSQPTGDDGLLVITNNHLQTRAANEMSKFFTTQNPNISFSNTADNVDSLKYSYLTPTRIDFPNKITVLSRLNSTRNDTNRRKIEYFFQDNDTMLKAVSLQADILNFKQDVTGKNRFLTESDRNNVLSTLNTQTSISRTLRRLYSKQKIVSNKISEVISDYASATFTKYSVSEEKNVDSVMNEVPLINFMNSLSSGALRKKDTSGYKKRRAGSGFVPNEIEEDYLTMSEKDLKHRWVMTYPGGSGPIGMMFQVTGLIQAVAKLRGIDTSEWK